MAYNPKVGLISIVSGGNYLPLPLNLIVEKSYKSTYSTLDLDSYRNANGVLKRNVLLKTVHCTVDTRTLKEFELQQIRNILSAGYASSGGQKENKVVAAVFIPELGTYGVGEFYKPDTEIVLDKIKDGIIYYEPMTFEFIGYKDLTIGDINV